MVDMEVDDEKLSNTQTYKELKVIFPLTKKCEKESDYIYDKNGYLNHRITSKI
jgi:hypothetical protein